MRSESWIRGVILTISRQTPAHRAARIGLESRMTWSDNAASTGRAAAITEAPNRRSTIQLSRDSPFGQDRRAQDENTARRADRSLGLLSTAMVLTSAVAVATVLLVVGTLATPSGSINGPGGEVSPSGSPHAKRSSSAEVTTPPATPRSAGTGKAFSGQIHFQVPGFGN